MMFIHNEILKQLTDTPDPGFQAIYDRMRHPEKHRLQPLLVYVDKVLNWMVARPTGTTIRCTHIHFPVVTEEVKRGILEFTMLSAFLSSLDRDTLQDTYIKDRIDRLNSKRARTQMPPEASFKKGNTAMKKWKAEKAGLKEELDHLNQMFSLNKSLLPDTIFNISLADQQVVSEGLYLYAVNVDDLLQNNKRAYLLSNTVMPIDELCKELLDKQDHLKTIRKIVLFDVDSKRMFKGFNQKMLQNIKEQGYNIKDLILFSFDKRSYRIKNTINKLSAIYDNYFQPPAPGAPYIDTYIFLEQELNALLGAPTTVPDIKWIGEHSEVAHNYMDTVREYGIDRLRSISVLNLYAMAMNKKVATMMMEDLFGGAVPHGLFDAELREEVDELEPEEKADLRSATNVLLELIVANWTLIIKEIKDLAGTKRIALVVPYRFLKDRVLRNQLTALLPGIKFELYSWLDVKKGTVKGTTIVILTYRDAGRYPFEIYPSLMEGPLDEYVVRPLILKALFNDRYQYCNYTYQRTLGQLLKNDFRYEHLGWEKVDALINDIRTPDQKTLIEDDDQDYDMMDQVGYIKVEYTDKGHATFYPSKLLIVNIKGSDRYRVIRADELPDEVTGYEVQPLEEVHEDLNLFEIRPEEEQELQYIKREYGVADMQQELWKVMLSKKDAEFNDSTALHDHIKAIVGDKGFIQLEYFRNNWLNPTSELLIPRRRRHFRAICDLLELPKVYYRLKLKKRASLRSNSRQSNAQMNALLKQMFNEGLFEKGISWDDLQLQHYIDVHELEEKGITQENINKELKVLVELLRDKLDLKGISKIERS